MTIKKNSFVAALVAASLILATQVNAASVTLDTLLDGGTISSGDKMASAFSYTAIGEMPPPEQIVVTPIIDINGNYGFRFNGPFLDLGGDGMSSDAFLEFTVDVTDPSMEIVGVELLGNPSVVGGTGIAQITETFLPTNSTTQLDIYDIEPGSFVGADSVSFDSGYKSIVVQKDILLSADQGAAATLSFFDQVFTQEQVPEPASAAMLIFGLLGILGARRRR